MNTMLINTLGLLMIMFVMFMIFKKIKTLLPSFLSTSLSPANIPVHSADDLDTDSENEEDVNATSNVIELDEEDINFDDVDSDDEIVLNKTSTSADDIKDVSLDTDAGADAGADADADAGADAGEDTNANVEDTSDSKSDVVESDVKVIKTKALKGLKNRGKKTKIKS